MTTPQIHFELRAIARSAEEGVQLERIVLVCGSTLYLGIPVSTAKFIEATVRSHAGDIAKTVGNWRTSQAEKEAQAEKKSRAAMEPYLAAVRNAADQETISLSPVQVLPPGLASYEVHAIRVRLDRVDAWWFGLHDEHPAKLRGSGSGVAVGVSF